MKVRLPRAWLALAAFAGAAAVGAVVAVPPLVVRRLETLDPEDVPRPGEMVDVGGVRIHYLAKGEGRPLVLIHGFGASTFSFRHALDELSRHFRVVAIDLPGFGFSDRPAHGDYSLRSQADVVAGAMERLIPPRGEGRRATVVGHSMGGAVALHLGSRRPDLVERLVVIAAPNASMRPRVARYVGALTPFFPAVSLMTIHNARLRERMIRRYCYDDSVITPDVLEAYFTPTRFRGTTRALSRMLTSLGTGEPLDPSTVRQPVLLLWGECDPVVPVRIGRELERALPNARLQIVERAGHLLPEERAGAVHDAILAFVRETDGGAAA